MIRNPKFGALLADKAFDVQWLIERLQAQGVQIVISQRSNRRRPLAIDEHMYRWRHLIENFFGKLKEFKRIAMRSDKTDARLQGGDLSGFGCDSISVILNRP